MYVYVHDQLALFFGSKRIEQNFEFFNKLSCRVSGQFN